MEFNGIFSAVIGAVIVLIFNWFFKKNNRGKDISKDVAKNNKVIDNLSVDKLIKRGNEWLRKRRG